MVGSVLLPVGLPGGMCVGLPEIPDGSGLVWTAGEIRHLDQDSYRLWRACATAPSPEQLSAWAGDEGLEGAAERVRELLAANLLVSDHARRLDSLSMRVIGEGLGNGDGSKATFRMKGRDGASVEVDPALFEVVMSSDGVTSLARVCSALDGNGSGSENRRREAIVAGLPVIVRAGVVRLDARSSDGE